MPNVISIGRAAQLFGVSIQTMRNWEKSGKLMPDYVSPGGTRKYSEERVLVLSGRAVAKAIPNENRMTLAYARVRTRDEREELKRQVHELGRYCSEHGYEYELITDYGSGLNDDRKGLQKLLHRILSGEIGRVVVNRRDRLLRFGNELLLSICEAKGVEVIFMNHGEGTWTEEGDEDLAEDMLDAVTLLALRLHGRESAGTLAFMEKLLAAIKGMRKVGTSSSN